MSYEVLSSILALERLAEVGASLADLHRELAYLLAEEARARVNGFLQSPETSVSGRERDAQAQALEATCSVFEVKGAIAALQEEQRFLLLLLEH